jgi:hypothetical protein
MEMMVTESARPVSLMDQLADRTGWAVTNPPDELIQVIKRLGYEADVVCAHSVARFDGETGVSSWEVVIATHAVLVQVSAEAARLWEPRMRGEKEACDWSMMVSHEREPKTYSQLPALSVRVRQLRDLAELRVEAAGSADAYRTADMIRETWTFTFRDGSEPVCFEVDHSDRERSDAVDELCRHLARQLQVV